MDREALGISVSLFYCFWSFSQNIYYNNISWLDVHRFSYNCRDHYLTCSCDFNSSLHDLTVFLYSDINLCLNYKNIHLYTLMV